MSPTIDRDHFLRAALEIGKNGDNDTLPYDIESQFIRDKSEDLADLCYSFFRRLEIMQRGQVAAELNNLNIESERLLVATGSHGFRITTKIHPFWNLYLNGIAFGVAEANESLRSDRAHSYRFSTEPDQLFDRAKSWRAYKEATLADGAIDEDGAVVVQTDISSFYERVYHHRLENALDYIFGSSTISVQIDRILNKISSGRSFGLPVGGQCARVLAEVMMSPIDSSLSDAGLQWHRYVDDFTIICTSQQNAYSALSVLSHALADFGLSLNRTKTTILSAKHYKEYVAAQLGKGEETSVALRELDLHFDPYSDQPQSDYDELKKSVEKIDIEFLLGLEREKSEPDAFVLAQVSRTLKFQDPQTAARLCATLLDPKNLDAFRASWSKIMRGVYAVRANSEFEPIFADVDKMLDAVPQSVPHLLLPEANVLHYLRAIRFNRTEARGRIVREIYERAGSPHTVRRACIDCWRNWPDRGSFLRIRNQWQNIASSEQRMLWLAASRFGDEGAYARKQLLGTLGAAWRLGIEVGNAPTFAGIYQDWAQNVP